MVVVAAGGAYADGVCERQSVVMSEGAVPSLRPS